MQLSGTVVPMATPIEERSGDVDESTLERFTDSLIEAGVHGLFPGSSIGEFSSLTREQNRTVIRTVAAATAGRVPVIAGCCDTSVEGVLESVESAAAADADAAVVVAPYYLTTTQRGLRRFFTRVADRAPMPVLLYNIPALTGNRIAAETVVALAEHDDIVGVKDTSGDLTYHHRIITETPEEFAVFQGATEMASSSLDLGTSGLIAGPANVFPAALTRLYEAHAANDRETVARLTRDVVAPLVSAMSEVPTAAAIKYLVAIDGLDLGDPLPPLPTLTARQRESLDRAHRHVVETVESASTER
ncbi:dihydrodipicolinate synthase family protein [Halomarina pelagica]|uniref:dihydrodipicolinate synthase family protein n=1 Tax=Halomarina pelagica TaxID=2961599 RepID=UPI002113CA86|nr:dihydrodipicolinate synthase family protein [Halomarina sp. BND7]